MPKRDEPGTSSVEPLDTKLTYPMGAQRPAMDGEPSAKRADIEIKQEVLDSSVDLSDTVAANQTISQAVIKTERGINVEEDDDEDSRSHIAAMEEDDDDDDDTDSVIEKNNIPSPDTVFLECCRNGNVPNEVANAGWEIYYYALQRVCLEGSQNAWQASSIYYYLLSRGIKRHGKVGRLLIQPFPVSILAVAEAFDVSIAELLDKTLRIVETVSSRKMRRYLDYIRKIQEGLSVTCVIFQKFCLVFREIFVDVPTSSDICPSSRELFSILWTSYLILKSRLQVDDLINNYHLMFSMLDQIYTEICSMQDGIVHHLNQVFVGSLIENDSTIIRALCSQFGGNILDARNFYEHTYKKIDKTGLPSTWDFQEFSNMIVSLPKITYDEYLLQRGNVDERIFIPTDEELTKIFQENFAASATNSLKVSRSGIEFKDANLLSQISNVQCLEKISQSRNGTDKQSQQLENSKKTYPNYNEKFETRPNQDSASENYNRLVRIIGNWKLGSSKLQSIVQSMSDNPMATILLKCDELCNKFEKTLDDENGENGEDSVMNRYHKTVRQSVEKLFLIFIEKIIVDESKKSVREEDLLNAIRREEFLESVFCFSTELALFCHGLERPFPWSAEVCDCHPFVFHKIIDFIVRLERRLSRRMVQHFNRIEESVIEYYSWKNDSPLWQMIVRCPLAQFQEFGDDWSEKLSSLTPTKHAPIKKVEGLLDDLGRPIVPQDRAAKTLRAFLKKTYLTAARRLQELTGRLSLGNRAKSQCWSLLDYLIRSDTLIFMDRHFDQILLCCVFVVLRINDSKTTFNEIAAQYRRQMKNKDAAAVYRNVTICVEQLETANTFNLKETVLERLNSPDREKVTVDIIQFYNVEFRDRIKYVIGQIDGALESELPEMPDPADYGMAPIRLYLTEQFSIKMLPKTDCGDSKEEKVIADIEENGVTLDAYLRKI